jgi:diacylglycerol kinase (ATP)
MSGPFLAIVNPAAGGGRCGRLADGALQQLRGANLQLEIVHTKISGEATSIARAAYARGVRNFIAVGGDGTAFEIVNGLFPEAARSPDLSERPVLGFLPLGTGNSFLRDFTDKGAEHSIAAIIENRRRPCDVLRLTHASGELYFINLLSVGFAADVATVTNRNFKAFRQFGYILGVIVCLVRLRRRAFPLRAVTEIVEDPKNENSEWDRRPCLFLSFNNSKFTGGNMMIAPKASTDDGLIEYVRWGPIGRLELVRNFSTLFDGTHINHGAASRNGARRIEFASDAPVDVMIDGEVLTLQCRSIDVLPAALDVFV